MNINFQAYNKIHDCHQIKMQEYSMSTHTCIHTGLTATPMSPNPTPLKKPAAPPDFAPSTGFITNPDIPEAIPVTRFSPPALKPASTPPCACSRRRSSRCRVNSSSPWRKVAPVEIVLVVPWTMPNYFYLKKLKLIVLFFLNLM